MNRNFYWKQFEQTGMIKDYLSYTACTSEDMFSKDAILFHSERKEGGYLERTGNTDGNGADFHAGW